MSKSGKKYFIVGMDEAGRGPLAGPVAIAAVAAIANFKSQKLNLKSLKGIKNSKKLSAKKREEWREILKKNFDYKVAMVGPAIIDKIGIQKATRLAVARALRKFSRPPGSCNHLVLLDGLMSAPRRYNQQTIVKGDEKIPLISAASIIAKTARDAKMLRLHKKFPEYCFNKHKGYGTKLHYKMLKKHGLCPIHRRSFCKNYLRKFLN